MEPESSTRKHSYLSGNFAPVVKTVPLEPCQYVGVIPEELRGGQYVRNSSNPVINHDLSREAHWFDGDGLLVGVYFRSLPNGGPIQPEFVSAFAITDVYQAAATNPGLSEPIPPSIATFLNPKATARGFLRKIGSLVRIIAGSYMGGNRPPIERIGVANTNIIYHNGRALALGESGPPLRITLPDLRTVGWFNGIFARGEPVTGAPKHGFGGSSMLRLFREMTTAHPRVDPHTQELILFHSTFIAPYVTYSVIPKGGISPGSSHGFLNLPVPGISSPKLMHDFGVSREYTVIIDLPITLSLTNLLRDRCVLEYHPGERTRFGIFPRHTPHNIRWFETDACCIFHTVNSWDTLGNPRKGDAPLSVTYVNMLVCRMTHPYFVFTAADLDPMPPVSEEEQSNLQCRLYYYQFSLNMPWNTIANQWALSAIHFEFPHVPRHLTGSVSRYVYGCSTTEGSLGTALGKAVKIDCLVKINASHLIEAGLQRPPEPVSGAVDNRNLQDVLASGDPDDPIQIFRMKPGWYAHECSFVGRKSARSEDDGYLLTFVFDESQLNSQGDAIEGACSELWILDAKSMQAVVGRILLPHRVPYGLHGDWFTADEIEDQQPVEAYRTVTSARFE